jgi:hypothetical protein
MSQSIDVTMRDSKRKASAIRRNFARCILDLQEEQHSMGITDPKGLACQASACCRNSRREAIERAADLAMEVIAHRHQEIAVQTSNIIAAVLDLVSIDEFDLGDFDVSASLSPPRERPAMRESPSLEKLPLLNRL